MFRALWTVGLALAWLSTTALAQTAEGTARSTCQSDRVKLCPGISGGDAIVRCLSSQREQLTEGCRKVVAAKTSEGTARSACQSDRLRLCPGVSGGEAIVACLKSYMEQLTEGCRKAFAAIQKADDPWVGVRKPK